MTTPELARQVDDPPATNTSVASSQGREEISAERDGLLELVNCYIVPAGAGRIQVRSATRTAVLSGKVVDSVLPRLFPLLDGTRTQAQVFEETRDAVAPERVRSVLLALESKGFLRRKEEPPEELFPAGSAEHYETLARYFDQRSGSRYTAIKALREATVTLVNSGPITAAAVSSLSHFGVGRIRLVGDEEVSRLDVQSTRIFQESDLGRSRVEVMEERFPLAKLGVELQVRSERPSERLEWQEALEESTVAAVTVGGPILFYPWLEAFDRAAAAAGLRWISAAVFERGMVHVGPAIHPGMTCCYKCFELRFKSNLSFLDSYLPFERFIHTTGEERDFGQMPPLHEIAGSLMALELVRMIDPQDAPRTSGKLLVWNGEDYSTSLHPVLKLPRCPHCGPSVGKPRVRVWS